MSKPIENFAPSDEMGAFGALNVDLFQQLDMSVFKRPGAQNDFQLCQFGIDGTEPPAPKAEDKNAMKFDTKPVPSPQADFPYYQLNVDGTGTLKRVNPDGKDGNKNEPKRAWPPQDASPHCNMDATGRFSLVSANADAKEEENSDKKDVGNPKDSGDKKSLVGDPTQTIERAPAKEFKEAVDKLERSVKMADFAMPAKDFDKTVGQLDHILLLLEKDRDRKLKFDTKTGDQNRQRVDSNELTLLQKTELLQSYQATTDKLTAPVKARLQYAEFLQEAGRLEDAAKIAADARNVGEKLIKPAKITDHITMSLGDIEARESDIRASSFGIANPLGTMRLSGDNVTKSLVDTNLFLAKLYMGPELDWQKNSIDKLGESKLFDPIKALDANTKAMSLIKFRPQFEHLYPAEKNTDEMKNLHSALRKVFSEPDKYKLSERTDSDGKPFSQEQIKLIRERLSLDLKSEGYQIFRDAAIIGAGASLGRYAPPIKK